MYKKKRKSKQGNILTENLIFIALNVAFFAIMILFLTRQTHNATILEQAYAKDIALMLDSAKPGMEIFLDIQNGAESDKEWFKKNFENSVTVNGNVVSVKLTEGKGYSYSFFNDVKPSIDVWSDGKVYIVINKNG